MAIKNDKFPKRPKELLYVQEMDELSHPDNENPDYEVEDEDIIPILDVSSSLNNRAKKIRAGSLVSKIAGDSFADRNLDNLDDSKEALANLGSFSSVAEVQSRHIPAVLESIRTFGRNAPGDGPPLDLVRGSEVPGAVQSADGQWWEDLGYNDIVVRVPSAFPDWQEAFDHYSRLPMRQGARIRILLETGHEPERGLHLRDGDYSQYTIEAEDPEVFLSAAFDGIASDPFEGIGAAPQIAIVFERCRAPLVNVLFNGRGHSTYGIVYIDGAWGEATQWAGFKHCARPLEVRDATFYGAGGDYSIATNVGIRITRSSVADISNCTVDDVLTDAVGTDGAVDISRGSIVYSLGIKIRRSGSIGLYVRRSFVSAEEAEVIDSAQAGVAISNFSFVGITSATVTGSGTVDIHLFTGGGFCSAINATFDTSNIIPNVYTSRGVIITGEASYATGTTSPQHPGTIDEVGGTKTDGYFIRSDGYACAWKQVEFDIDGVSIKTVPMPLAIQNGAVVVNGDSSRGLTTGSGFPARLAAFADLVYETTGDGASVVLRIPDALQTASGPLQLMVFLFGYINKGVPQ